MGAARDRACPATVSDPPGALMPRKRPPPAFRHPVTGEIKPLSVRPLKMARGRVVQSRMGLLVVLHRLVQHDGLAVRAASEQVARAHLAKKSAARASYGTPESLARMLRRDYAAKQDLVARFCQMMGLVSKRGI